MDVAESPTTFNIVAGASMIVAIIVYIGKTPALYPIIVIIIISEIVPPPIGTAVINNVATKDTNSILDMPANPEILVPNRHTKNITLNTLPIIEPSL